MGGYGWICDCGKWITGDDETHFPRMKWFREVHTKVKRKKVINGYSVK